MKKPRLREVKCPVSGHTAKQGSISEQGKNSILKEVMEEGSRKGFFKGLQGRG